MSTIGDWARALPERYGKATLLALVAILVLGLGLRAYRVAEPLATPGDDSRAYYALAKALYEKGSYGSGFENASDWSPGAPLLYAAAFYATGGPREGTARIVEALLGTAAIAVVFLLGRRLALAMRLRGRPGAAVGLLAAFGVAVYPPFIHSTGALMSEPPAMLTLPAAVLAFLWAGDPPATARRPALRWLLPGLLFGLTAMIRPEYLLVGLAFVALALIRGARSALVTRTASSNRGLPSAAGPGGQGGWLGRLVPALAVLAGIAVVVAPWAIRNQIVLERTVPISTGSGKALYVGTFLPADGEYQRVKAILFERFEGKRLPPHSDALEKVDPTPLFDRVAARYPDLPRDSALGKIGKQNFSTYFGEDPVGYLAMAARKVGRMWSSGVGEAMSSPLGRGLQIALVVAGIAGLGLLGRGRRWWELIAFATPIGLVTAVGAISLAAPRRNEVLMTLVFPLVGLALSATAAAISSAREWSPGQASSPPS